MQTPVVDLTCIQKWTDKNEITALQGKITDAHEKIMRRSGAGADFLGWVDLPLDINKQLAAIKQTAERIRKNSDTLVVTGIGGSYLGARAVIEMLSPSLFEHSNKLKIFYAGHNVSGDYMTELLKILEQRNVYINVISKSGTTLEPAVAFRLLREFMHKKYKNARERIIATTDSSRGALKEMAKRENYQCFVIPDDVGGRYSVLTPVGLLPIACAGIDIEALTAGAADMRRHIIDNPSIEKNSCFAYAAARNLLYKKGKNIEIMVNYLPRLAFFSEWWKQLYGESEGKQGKGIFPASVNFTTDLHSLGQLLQEGERNLFETVLHVNSENTVINVPSDEQNFDKLNYLSGTRLEEINHQAENATCLAHVNGGVPVIKICLQELTPYTAGALVYFYEYACALSGYYAGVNPFDQPGVEAYKKNMFALLGHKDYEVQKNNISRELDALEQTSFVIK